MRRMSAPATFAIVVRSEQDHTQKTCGLNHLWFSISPGAYEAGLGLFTLLPNELLVLILQALPFRDLVALSTTSRGFYAHTASLDSVWQRFFVRTPSHFQLHLPNSPQERVRFEDSSFQLQDCCARWRCVRQRSAELVGLERLAHKMTMWALGPFMALTYVHMAWASCHALMHRNSPHRGIVEDAPFLLLESLRGLNWCLCFLWWYGGNLLEALTGHAEFFVCYLGFFYAALVGFRLLRYLDATTALGLTSWLAMAREYLRSRAQAADLHCRIRELRLRRDGDWPRYAPPGDVELGLGEIGRLKIV
eukprot:TRINITY_DN5348_c1_g1_i1.p1 TRINITY_DN5348_c1_g1~~TRINITY_DN5348_c1_g1_i1.p1  ORF type:complete len:306 (-),score=16.58 TRINITY_DN5348_c1_g1_i1:284-1201(-)